MIHTYVPGYRMFWAISVLLVVFTPVSYGEPIKKSASGICHDSNSQYYERTERFTAYPSIAECLDSGGRLPGKSSQKENVTATSPSVQGSSKYHRSHFGDWADFDGDCINTRHELLVKQSTSTVDKGSNPCTVVRGKWFDPYTGKTFYQARDVDIDHLVPLKWAWDHGAYHWSKEKRVRFANDESNLIAVQASVNREKGAKGILEWLPPDKTFHCQYILRFTRITKSYGLGLSDYEQRKFADLRVQKCGQ